MKLATTTGDFDRYTNSYCDSIRCIRTAGFRNIDLSFSKKPTMQEALFGDDWKREVEKLKACADEQGVRFVQAHVLDEQNLFSPGVDPDVVRADIIRCIQICGLLGIPQMVMHGQRSDSFSFEHDKWLEANRKTLLEFAPWFEEAGVNILIENGPRKHALAKRPDGTSYDPPKYYCSAVSGKLLREFVTHVDHPMVRACWDTGHANMNGPQYDDILALGDLLNGLHVHDNRGDLDEHALPFFGSLNFDELMHALIDCGYQGFFTFEVTRSLGCECIRKENRRQFPEDTRLFTPSLDLKLSIERFMYEAGKHILTSYNCFEE